MLEISIGLSCKPPMWSKHEVQAKVLHPPPLLLLTICITITRALMRYIIINCNIIIFEKIFFFFEVVFWPKQLHYQDSRRFLKKLIYPCFIFLLLQTKVVKRLIIFEVSNCLLHICLSFVFFDKMALLHFPGESYGRDKGKYSFVVTTQSTKH